MVTSSGAAHDAPVALPLPDRAASFLERGAELGRFNMGSTVILLLPAGLRRVGRESGGARRAPGGQGRRHACTGVELSAVDGANEA